MPVPVEITKRVIDTRNTDGSHVKDIHGFQLRDILIEERLVRRDGQPGFGILLTFKWGRST